MESKLTPLMQQYWEIKSQHMDKILMFRMGDFFEMFHDDAVTAAPILNIALTSRNKKQDDTPMCGMPHHSIAGPVGKLLAAGHKVALCDQIEDPKLAKGIVKRAVTRILSPGMVYDPETLDQLQANYLCSYDKQTIAFLEVTTGESFYYHYIHDRDREKLLALLMPSEIVVSAKEKSEILKDQGFSAIGHLTAYDFDNKEIVKEEHLELPATAKRLLAYACYMQSQDILNGIKSFQERKVDLALELPPTVVRHLELFETYKGDKKGSLFHAINRTKTSGGARLLKSWLQFPLTQEDAILKRQKQVGFWVENSADLKDVRTTLSRIGDIERRLAKVLNPNCHVHDLLSLAQSLSAGLKLTDFLREFDEGVIDLARQIEFQISDMLVEEPPVAVKSGGFLRRGLNGALDELIAVAEDSQQLLADMELLEKERTGIPSLKIRYNNVFGYYIEVTKTHTNKVPDHYKRKQTLANAERYVTQELQELEDKILSARSKRVEMEIEIFNQMRSKVTASHVELLSLAYLWSELDVFTAFAWLALEFDYVRPTFSAKGDLNLVNSRHPVVEQEVTKPFVPNTVTLKHGECLLLTGPNMAGKSTIMRQVAINSIIAQMGSFIPAEKAELPLFDRIFTRIGASDYLAEGLSTFMVEMQETAQMLNQATSRSLLILDEVGRGTSTYDGMSLAQSILEYLVTKTRSMTLFATHYHELTHLESKFPMVHNAHMSITEKGSEICFLHSLVPGPANKSYGIQVASLAGLPKSVVNRAKGLLKLHEESMLGQDVQQMALMPQDMMFNEQVNGEKIKLLEELEISIKNYPTQSMTPIEALNKIVEWQQSLS